MPIAPINRCYYKHLARKTHVIRLLMGAFVLGLPEHKLRVVSPDVGGGFGSKIFHYAEEAIVTWAAKRLERPIKWTSDRSEAFMSDAHGRDHVTHAELALDADGTFTGLRVSTDANLGAYISTFGAAVPTYLHGTLLSGCYCTPAIYANVKGVFTNTVPVDAYRGAGRPEAAFLIERLVHKAAVQLGLDPVEIRRKNFIKPDQFPYQTPVLLEYDVGDYGATLDAVLELADYHSFGARREEAVTRGKLRGIGLSTFVEACGIAPSAVAGALGARAGLFEVGHVRIHPTGSITVFTGSHSHGQGHETTFAQLVSDRLGVPIDQVDVVHGDTAQVAFGMGTYGSRSIAVGGSAIYMAMEKIIDKGKKIAAHLMEAAVSLLRRGAGEDRAGGGDAGHRRGSRRARPVGADPPGPKARPVGRHGRAAAQQAPAHRRTHAGSANRRAPQPRGRAGAAPRHLRPAGEEPLRPGGAGRRPLSRARRHRGKSPRPPCQRLTRAAAGDGAAADEPVSRTDPGLLHRLRELLRGDQAGQPVAHRGHRRGPAQPP